MSIKTLLVDDDKSLLEQAKIFLNRVGEEINLVTISSVEKALDMIDDNDFDVIVSDYQMPEMDGLKFLEEIRKKRNNDITFIIFTGKSREEIAIKALNLGADRYIQKGGNPKSQYKVLMDAIVQEHEKWQSKKRLQESKEKLRKSQKKYKKIFYETPLGIFHYDRDGVIIECNNKLVEIIGSSRDEILGFDMLKGLDNEKVVEEIKSSLEEGEGCYEGEYNSVTGGKKTIVRVLLKGIEDDQGEIDSGIALIEDITDRKEAKQELKYREKLERIITEAATGLMNIEVEKIDESIERALKKLGEFTGADRSYVFQFNENLEKMDMTHEWCAEDIETMKRKFQDFSTDRIPWLMKKIKEFENITIPELSDLPPEAETFEKFLREQKIQSMLVLPIIFEDELEGLIGFNWVEKEKEWSEEIVDLLRIAGEAIESALNRKEVEKKLRESKNRLNGALNGADLGVWDWNVETDEVKYSEEWAEILGYSRDKMGEKLDSWEEKIHPNDLPRVKKELEKHIEGETQLYETEHRIESKSGDWILVKSLGKIIERDENGDPLRAMGIHEDITDQKKSD